MSKEDEAYDVLRDAQGIWIDIANKVDVARIEYERYVGELALANKAWREALQAWQEIKDD